MKTKNYTIEDFKNISKEFYELVKKGWIKKRGYNLMNTIDKNKPFKIINNLFR
jgi:hypothetical protein